ncbi:IS110 family transposase [Sphingobium tyrosinilyticum]|uniref:IS110 family transposase n=1 Tax=Sphingobium tyrosinilyticum TaxID=2715436 RepID=A0ABV9F1C7_9SPHN
MSVVTIGLDLAKTVFQVHGVDKAGHTVLRRKLSRGDLVAFFKKQPQRLVGMEACSSAHHWGRLLVELGHTVRLIPPQYVKPFVKRNKTDAADAEAICEAVARPNMRFVPIKTKQQQAILALHRVRSLLVRQRTATINALRGLLGEYGIIAGKGVRQLATLSERLVSADETVVPSEAQQALRCLFQHIEELSEKLKDMELRIVAWHKADPVSQRLASAPGVGPITASAIVAAVGDGKQFKSSRHFAAWLGLTPRIKASGGKEKIGRISKGGDRYLRTLLIHGARAVVGTTFRKDVAPRPWLTALVARRPTNVAATAVAHKTARSLWAMLTREELYRRHSAQLMAA